MGSMMNIISANAIRKSSGARLAGTTENQIPRCKQRGIKLATLQSSGVFDPRGIRQLAVQARPLGSLLAGINSFR